MARRGGAGELTMRRPGKRAPRKPGSPAGLPFTPTADVATLFDLGIQGTPLVQYLAWADQAGVFRAMDRRSAVTARDIARATPLNERGADALLGVLAALGVVKRDKKGRFIASALVSQYLVPDTPFYVGLALYGMLDTPLPKAMLGAQRPHRFSDDVEKRWNRNRFQFGRMHRLRIQHSRNFPAGVAGARSGAFDGIRHLVDIGGGTGTFAIPLALDHPDMRITLVELPQGLRNVRVFLRAYGLASRIALRGFNVYESPWPFPERGDTCDGILFGNFLHACDDDEARYLLRQSHEALAPNGRLLLHEMLWNADKTGPLETALWNFEIVRVSAGRQRTALELITLLDQTGFGDARVVPTLGSYSLVVGKKRRRSPTSGRV
jgi:SAM-dependent methyltransferase